MRLLRNPGYDMPESWLEDYYLAQERIRQTL
jgi:hypothetical protein